MLHFQLANALYTHSALARLSQDLDGGPSDGPSDDPRRLMRTAYALEDTFAALLEHRSAHGMIRRALRTAVTAADAVLEDGPAADPHDRHGWGFTLSPWSGRPFGWHRLDWTPFQALYLRCDVHVPPRGDRALYLSASATPDPEPEPALYRVITYPLADPGAELGGLVAALLTGRAEVRPPQRPLTEDLPALSAALARAVSP
ncbi:hypothetical protein [Actinocorallia sp. A-T 12471]|uniref:hypothetical protein n=1 Tax=Actinocorallia sp. A-T 12471 TaxID=3089813 RepID=UPI0029CB4F82|nr:hypothetical protein [Actinocorallia sp. A-T 12471]MDX6741196.1 hypothetical protein [Actinocorallia sp. A-T 12471]